MNRLTGLKTRFVLAGTLLLTGAAAWAADAPPTDQMALARAAIEQAQNAGATESAPLQLKNAQDRFNDATALLGKNRRRDYPQARRLAELAESEARLARSMTEAERAEKSLAEVQESTQVLRTEMQRNTRP